ncbi:hypothetical protein FRC12_023365 [Ceratobasidium sp. 428]|nr:hypothetical protein FRC12_023365 [Ceratobasidium sp. 428]
MTKKELVHIARIKGIVSTSDFDRPEVNWPGSLNLRLEVLVLLTDLQRVEDNRIAWINEQACLKREEKDRKRQADAEEAVRKKEEATRKKEEAARKKADTAQKRDKMA